MYKNSAVVPSYIKIPQRPLVSAAFGNLIKLAALRYKACRVPCQRLSCAIWTNWEPFGRWAGPVTPAGRGSWKGKSRLKGPQGQVYETGKHTECVCNRVSRFAQRLRRHVGASESCSADYQLHLTQLSECSTGMLS